MKIRILLFILFISSPALLQAQQPGELTVEKIMRDPAWIGSSPNGINWSEDGKKIYFNWNPDNNKSDSLYAYQLASGQITKTDKTERMAIPSSRGSSYSKDRGKMVYVKNGDLFLMDIKKGKTTQITNTTENISNPVFNQKEDKIIFQWKGNLYTYTINGGLINQVTNFQQGGGRDRNGSGPKSEQDKYLETEELDLIQILNERKEKREASARYRESQNVERPLEINTSGKSVMRMQLSPDEKYVSYVLYHAPKGSKNTEVPNYVVESSYAEMINARAKVGSPQGHTEMEIYDISNRKTYTVQLDELDGLATKPEFWSDYDAYAEKEAEKRKLIISEPLWSDNGQHAVIQARTIDNKDRYILKLNLQDGSIKQLHHERDEAWIAGPGLGYLFGSPTWGFMPDDEHLWFQSEESGYSHLYKINVNNGQKTALTNGKFEIYDPQISKDKKFWYFTANIQHPGVRHLYKMPLNGGAMEQLTALEGKVDFELSPDEKHIALLYSKSNRPAELYLLPNKKGAAPKQLTHSVSDEFLSYNWREANVITFEAEDGAEVYARLYTPDAEVKHGAAVIFVHGAGYLHNAHKWWSTYFREYMFHNMLTDMGYTVLDIDYRGSAGYGRDWRTGIYRHMGGKDLSDQVDGAKYLVREHGVDADKIGIYGGSYGGFITLMAMFNESKTFAAGAALRSVTDWAHYNHGYTSNILNTPVEDPIAYKRSSPIYFAEGLEGHLLIAHGMVDVNVHFQDVVRLAQRLIELGKDNWEMAVYPVEDHGFVEPSSWTDEYKRILKLFEERLR